MDLRQLGYFLSIAEHGGFAAAARARYISQSALSRQMQLLEEEIGTPLLKRSARGVMLTNAGETLRDRAKLLFLDIEGLKEDVLAEAQTPAGRVAIGFTPSMRVMLAGNLIETFTQRYPMVHLGVIEGLSHAMADATARGLCDVGVFIRDDAIGRPLQTRLLIEEPMVVVGHANAGLAMNRPAKLSWVARQRLLISRSNRVSSGLEKEAAKLGASLNVVMDIQPLHLSMDLVCRGFCHLVVPYSAAVREYEAGMVSMAPIAGFTTGWVVAWPSDRKVSIATLKLVDAVAAEFERLHVDRGLDAALGVRRRRTRPTRA